MAEIQTTDLRGGMKVEVDGQPFVVVKNEFVKPGKGQAFNRIRIKQMITGKVIEKTHKSGDSLTLADVKEAQMRMLYKEAEGVVLMDDESYEQITIPFASVGETEQWLMEDVLYGVIFYKGAPVLIEPPTFMELKVTQTDPGDRGNTASGRVLKPALLETGARIQVPIFIEEEEVIKVDTRTGEYVSRASK